MDETEPRRRLMDNSNRVVRNVLAGSIETIGAWRNEVALLKARAARFDGHETDKLQARCSEIETGIMEIRMSLLAELADAPHKVRGHSRVVDVEKALDNLEAALSEVRGPS
jgi:hypothetical protein